jgi:hypothetical protein
VPFAVHENWRMVVDEAEFFRHFERVGVLNRSHHRMAGLLKSQDVVQLHHFSGARKPYFEFRRVALLRVAGDMP